MESPNITPQQDSLLSPIISPVAKNIDNFSPAKDLSGNYNSETQTQTQLQSEDARPDHKSNQMNLSIKRIPISASKSDSSPDSAVQHPPMRIESVSKNTNQSDMRRGSNHDDPLQSKLNSIADEQGIHPFEVEINLLKDQNAEAGSRKELSPEKLRRNNLARDEKEMNLINIQCSNVQLSFMDAAEQAAHNYAVKESGRKQEDARQYAKSPTDMKVEVYKQRSRKSGQHSQSQSGFKPGRYAINQRVRKGTDTSSMSMTQQNLNKIRMSHQCLSNINFLQSQRAIDGIAKKGSYKLMSPYEQEVEPIFEFEKLSGGMTTKASLANKSPAINKLQKQSSFSHSTTNITRNPTSQLASRKAQQRVKNQKYQTGTSFFNQRKSIQDNQKIDMISQKREAKTSDRRFRNSLNSRQRSSHQDFGLKDALNLGSKMNSDIPIIIQSHEDQFKKRHQSQPRSKVVKVSSSRPLYSSQYTQHLSPPDKEEPTQLDNGITPITQTPLLDYTPDIPNDTHHIQQSLSTECIQHESTLQKNNQIQAASKQHQEKRTKLKSQGQQLKEKQLYKLQKLIVNDQFEQYNANKYVGESQRKVEVKSGDKTKDQVLITEQSNAGQVSPGGVFGALKDRTENGTEMRKDDATVEVKVKVRTSTAKTQRDEDGKAQKEELQNPLQKVFPNLHFDKNKNSVMEIFVLKDEKVPPSAGSLNLDREDENSPGKEVPISKNSAYVKNMIAQKKLQDAKYKSQVISQGQKQNMRLNQFINNAFQYQSTTNTAHLANSFSPNSRQPNSALLSSKHGSSATAANRSPNAKPQHNLTNKELNADLKFTNLNINEEKSASKSKAKRPASQLSSPGASGAGNTTQNRVLTQEDQNQSGTLSFSEKESEKLGKVNALKSPNIKSRKEIKKKKDSSFNNIQKGVEIIQAEECPLNTINQQTRRIKEEKNQERKAARAEFEKRQSEHVFRRENKVLAKHDKKKVVSMSMMTSPLQTLGKVSMICRRQENIMSDKLVETRESYLTSPVHVEKSSAEKQFGADGGLSSRQYQMEKSKFQMSNKMICKLETKYKQESSPSKSCWDQENEDKVMSGKVKQKYIHNKSDQTVFSRMVPNLPDTFETNIGTKLSIEETKAKLKKHNQLKQSKTRYLSGKQYHEMNEFEKETYTLMHELRIDIKPETLQARLHQYIKENKDEEKLSAFCKDLEVAQQAKQAKKAQDEIMKQKLSKQRTMRTGRQNSLSPKSDETLDTAQRVKLRRKKTRQLLERKGTSTREIVEMYLQETQEEDMAKEEEDKQNLAMERSVGPNQQAGTTFSITATQRNSILRRLESIPEMEKQHADYIEERKQEHSIFKTKLTMQSCSKAKEKAQYLEVMNKVKGQLAKRSSRSDFQLNMDDYKSFEKIPFTPEQKSESSDSMISIKEEESEATGNKSQTESTTSEGTKQRQKEEVNELNRREQENRLLRKLQLKEEQDKETLARKKLQKKLTSMALFQQEEDEKHNNVLSQKIEVIDEMQYKRSSKFGIQYNMLHKTANQNLNLLRNIRRHKEKQSVTPTTHARVEKIREMRNRRNQNKNAKSSTRSDCRAIAKSAHLSLKKKPDEEIKHQFGWIDKDLNNLAKIDDDNLKYIGGIYDNLDKLRRDAEKDTFDDIILSNIISDDKQLLLEEAELVRETKTEINEKVSIRQFLRDLFMRAHKRVEDGADVSSDESMNDKCWG